MIPVLQKLDDAMLRKQEELCHIISVLIRSDSYYYLMMILQTFYHSEMIILIENVIEKLVSLLFAPTDPNNKKNEKVVFLMRPEF